MACCGDKVTAEAQQNQVIEKQINEDKRVFTKEIKLLLLGAGDSGKSTIAKQMKIIHLDGFSEQERLHYRPVVIANTVQSIKALILASEKFGFHLLQPVAELAANIVKLNAVSVDFNQALGQDIKTVWSDPSIQAAYQRQAEFQLPGVAEYCFSNIDRFAAPDYVPTVQDALRCRARTTGIIETVFTVENLVFGMVDVGGQRSERRKWIKCFQDVTAVLFVVAMNEYDMKLFEDDAVNRMHESLALFDEICNSVWFKNTTLLLFLNKSDLFREKITRVPLSLCFPEAPVELNTFDRGSDFLKSKFLERNNGRARDIYVHVTCATDTDAVRLVFTAVKDAILKELLAATAPI